MGCKGMPFPHLQFYGGNVPPTSDCYNAVERHTTIVTGPNLNVAFLLLLFCTLTTDEQQMGCGTHLVGQLYNHWACLDHLTR